METEWEVRCASGHRIYVRVEQIARENIEFTDCPECGEPRRGHELRPVLSADAPRAEVLEQLRERVREAVEQFLSNPNPRFEPTGEDDAYVLHFDSPLEYIEVTFSKEDFGEH